MAYKMIIVSVLYFLLSVVNHTSLILIESVNVTGQHNYLYLKGAVFFLESLKGAEKKQLDRNNGSL